MSYLKNMAAGAVALLATACATPQGGGNVFNTNPVTGAFNMVTGPGQNATPEQRRCHEMASNGRFMNVAGGTLLGTGAGAAVGAATGSAGKGAAVGALLGALGSAVQQGGQYTQAYNACVNNPGQWDNQYQQWQKEQPQQPQQYQNMRAPH